MNTANKALTKMLPANAKNLPEKALKIPVLCMVKPEPAIVAMSPYPPAVAVIKKNNQYIFPENVTRALFITGKATKKAINAGTDPTRLTTNNINKRKTGASSLIIQNNIAAKTTEVIIQI